MRLVACLVVILCGIFTAPAWAAEPIPGPLGKESMRIEGNGNLHIRFIPRQEDQPVVEFGDTVPVTLIAAATPASGTDHPFDLFVALTPQATAGATADVGAAYLRCGTISADPAYPVPGTAISASHTPTKQKNREGVTTYSVAPSKRVSVGVLNFPALAAAAHLEDTMKKQLPVGSFSLGLERDATLRFYAELTFQDGILALMLEVPEWEYIDPPAAD